MAFNDPLPMKNSTVYPADFSAQVARAGRPLYYRSEKAAPAAAFQFPYVIEAGSAAYLEGRVYVRAEDDNGVVVPTIHGKFDVSVAAGVTNVNGTITKDVKATITPLDGADTITGAAFTVDLVQDAQGFVYFRLNFTGATANPLLWFCDLKTTAINKKAAPFRGI